MSHFWDMQWRENWRTSNCSHGNRSEQELSLKDLKVNWVTKKFRISLTRITLWSYTTMNLPLLMIFSIRLLYQQSMILLSIHVSDGQKGIFLASHHIAVNSIAPSGVWMLSAKVNKYQSNIPFNFLKAVNSNESLLWNMAIKNELQSMREENGVCKRVKLP